MRHTLLFAILLSATILLAAGSYQPLNVKPGLWHVTGTNQFGPGPVKLDYKKCITQKDLSTNPWVNGPEEKCTWTVVTSTGTDMEVKGTSCEAGKEYGMVTNVDVKMHAVDSENVKASMQGTSTSNGQTMNVNGAYTGKWMGASCPAGTD